MEKADLEHVLPRFYRVRRGRGFHDNLARFSAPKKKIKFFFSFFFLQINMHLYSSGDIGDRLALQ